MRRREAQFIAWARERSTSGLALLATAVGLSFAFQSLFFVLYFRGDLPPAGDSALYSALAQALAESDGFSIRSQPTAIVPPLYPLMLAPFFALDIDGDRTFAFLGILLGSGSAGLIALIARRAFGVTEGWVAGLIAAGLPTIAFWSPYMLTDTLALALLAGAVLALAHPAGVSLRGATVGGVLLGAGFLTRPAMGFLAIALLAWLCLRHVQPRRFATTAAAVAAMTVVISPWALRNEVTIGRPYVSTSFTGANMWTAVHWLPDGRATFGVDIPPLPQFAGASEPKLDDLQRNQALAVLRAKPDRYLRGLYEKPRLMWTVWVPGFSAMRNFSETWVTLLGALALAGFLLRSEARRGGAWWLWVSGAMTLSAMLLYVDYDLRYRLPLAVAVVPPAAAALVAFLRQPPGFMRRRPLASTTTASPG